MKGITTLMYTAIHEFATMFTAQNQAFLFQSRCHTREFWAILHRLLEKSEKKGIYRNVFRQEKEIRGTDRKYKGKLYPSERNAY
jgi:hypothetical protein